MSQRDKMIEGKAYNASDKILVSHRISAREMTFKYNNLYPDDEMGRLTILRELLGKAGNNIYIEPPFHCDYGFNIYTGNNFYANFNLTILDSAKIVFGDNVLIAPNVTITTASHPIYSELRINGFEHADTVKIGNNVWISANCVINPGITIGDNSVIGAGSVVTRDIPANVLAFGSPCRMVRFITYKDREKYVNERF